MRWLTPGWCWLGRANERERERERERQPPSAVASFPSFSPVPRLAPQPHGRTRTAPRPGGARLARKGAEVIIEARGTGDRARRCVPGRAGRHGQSGTIGRVPTPVEVGKGKTGSRGDPVPALGSGSSEALPRSHASWRIHSLSPFFFLPVFQLRLAAGVGPGRACWFDMATHYLPVWSSVSSYYQKKQRCQALNLGL